MIGLRPAVPVVLCVFAFAVLTLGCGSHGYSGTWKWADGVESQTLVIERDGDHWKVIDSIGRPHQLRLLNGRLVESGESNQAFELRDGKLAMLDDRGGVVVEFERQ